MANLCCSYYVIDGDSSELMALYDIMKGLESSKEPSIANEYGPAWLGCLVDVLGSNWEDVNCRGEWNNLDLVDNTLRLSTETAWEPCNQVFDLVCKSFPTLHYYYQSEETNTPIYQTNDKEGKYFNDKYHVEIFTPEGECSYGNFPDLENVYKCLGTMFNRTFKSSDDINKLVEDWKTIDENAYCNIEQIRIIE